MNRTNLQRLADERVHDARILLDNGQWSGAYYLAGYAVECGLKSCVLAHIERTGIIFLEKRFVESCWTHDIEPLVKAAGLVEARRSDTLSNLDRKLNWQRAQDWNETARYELKTEDDARDFYKAVADPTHGVLPWIKIHW